VAKDYDRLKAIPLFASLREADLQYVGDILQEGFCPAGTFIIQQDGPSDKFFIIVDGEVSVLHSYGPDVRVGIRTLKKYDFFGESGLLQGRPRDATVEAISGTAYFYVEKPQFDEMLARLPSVKEQIEAASARRSKAFRLASFKGLGPDEVALWVAQRNLIPLIWQSLPGLVIWNSLVVALAVLAFFSTSIWREQWPALPWLLGAGAVVMFTLVWAWYLVDWTNDYLVLTNRRIIYKEVFGFLRETRQEIPIEAVQNVLLEIRGPIFKLLDLADISVQTIGGRLKFEHIRDAEDLMDRILDRRDMLKLEAKGVERDAISQELQKALSPVPSTQKSAWDILPAVVPKPAWLERLRASRQMRLEKTGEITWRRHWLFLAKRMVGPFVYLLLGIVAIPAGRLLAEPVIHGRLADLVIRGPLGWLLVLLVVIVPAFLWALWEYAVWGGDIYTLTDDRIIDIERFPLGLRGEKRRESQLDRIQDIDVDIPNVFSRFFNMGDVKIKTGAAGSDLTFRGVADPYSVQRDVFHRLAKLRRKEEERQRRQRFQEMITWLTVYDKLKVATSSGSGETETSS